MTQLVHLTAYEKDSGNQIYARPDKHAKFTWLKRDMEDGGHHPILSAAEAGIYTEEEAYDYVASIHKEIAERAARGEPDVYWMETWNVTLPRPNLPVLLAARSRGGAGTEEGVLVYATPSSETDTGVAWTSGDVAVTEPSNKDLISFAQAEEQMRRTDRDMWIEHMEVVEAWRMEELFGPMPEPINPYEDRALF